VVAGGALPAEGWAAAVEVGAERVVVLPGDEPWLLSRVAASGSAPVERGAVLAVTGSCGGAGASTVAAAVALAAAPGALLVDGDPWGGGLDLVLGAERVEGLRWPELTGLRGRLAGDALLAALPEVAGVHVLAADRAVPADVPPTAVTAVTESAAAAGSTVVLDLPRAAAGHPEGPASSADLTVLVVPARLRAAGAARLLADAEGSPWARAALVVRPLPGGLAVGEVAEVVGRSVLAVLPHDRSAVPRGERGEPPSVAPRSPFGTVARRVLSALARQRRAA
jgi:secretion/DNA translocation related CpaE-like protein